MHLPGHAANELGRVLFFQRQLHDAKVAKAAKNCKAKPRLRAFIDTVKAF